MHTMHTQVQRERLLGLLCVLVVLATKILGGDGGGHLHKTVLKRSLVDHSMVGDIFFEIIDPPELEYTYRLRPAKDFGTVFNSSFLEQGIALVPTDPATGCHQAKNAEQLRGRVALVERGDCTFFLKTLLAENAGAKAIIISDYYPSSMEEARSSPMWIDYYYIEMIRDNSIPSTKTVNIPAGFLLGKNGRMIKATLSRLNRQFALINIPVNLTHTSLHELNQPPWLSW